MTSSFHIIAGKPRLDLLIDGFLDALRLCIQRNPHGHNFKDFAKKRIWRTKGEDVAKNTLSQILTGDRGIKEQELLAILDEGDPAPVIGYLCQRYGFKMPEPAKPQDLQGEILDRLSMAEQLLTDIKKRMYRAT